MKGVTIRAFDRDTHTSSCDLRGIVERLGSDATRSVWRVRGAECVGGDAAVALHAASDGRTTIEGERFVALARDVAQVIEGEFEAILPPGSTPWVIIRAVDGGAFDVLSARRDVLATLRASFCDVQEYPDSELDDSD